MTVADARQAWQDAGFTGPFSPTFGLNNKVVETQNQGPGTCLPAASSIAVTYS